jgi:hypothetical protein
MAECHRNNWQYLEIKIWCSSQIVDKTAANSVQSFMIVFIYQTVHLVSISAAFKITCGGCLFFLLLILYVYIYMIS